MARDPLTFGPKPPFPKQQQSAPGDQGEMDPKPDTGADSYTGRSRLTDRVALVTGADSGIGRAVATLFAKEGADVVITHVPGEEKDAQITLDAITKAGRKAHAIAVDFTDPADAFRAVEETVQKFGKLDIAVANAAYQRSYEKLEDISGEEFEKHYRVNVGGTFALAQAAAKRLLPGGVILATTSIEAYEPGANILVYASTKAAIANLVKGLAKLLAKQGIRVNGVAPGPVWTPLIPATMPAEKVEKFGANTVFERPAQPVELGALYVFLASDDASFVSGEIYGATGGRTPL